MRISVVQSVNVLLNCILLNKYIDEGIKYEFKSLTSVDLFDDDNIFTNWIIDRKFDSVFLTKHINNKIPNSIRDMLLSSAVSGDIGIIN